MIRLKIEDEGRSWVPFSCEYETADGKFGFVIYAISHEHAVAMMEELKQTAKVLGQIVGEVPNAG